MSDVFDTTPAYTVTTTAYTVDGTTYGDARLTITRGQVAQHRLYCEPDDRAAQRIAQGQHETIVKASGRYDRTTTGLPLVVRVIDCTLLPTIRSGDVVAIEIGERGGERHYDVTQVADDMARVWPVDDTDRRDGQWIGLEHLRPVLNMVAFRRMMIEGGRTVDGAWFDVAQHATAMCSGRGRSDGTPRHDLCTGWILLASGEARECICCPCHDDARMSRDDAVAVTRDRVAAKDYAEAVAAAGANLADDRLIEAGDTWLTRRGALLDRGFQPAGYGLVDLPSELAELLHHVGH